MWQMVVKINCINLRIFAVSSERKKNHKWAWLIHILNICFWDINESTCVLMNIIVMNIKLLIKVECSNYRHSKVWSMICTVYSSKGKTFLTRTISDWKFRHMLYYNHFSYTGIWLWFNVLYIQPIGILKAWPGSRGNGNRKHCRNLDYL